MEKTKVYSESTLKQWTKDKLIEYIRILTEKYNSMAQTVQPKISASESEPVSAGGIKQIKKMVAYCRHTGMGKNKSLDMIEKVAEKYLSGKEDSGDVSDWQEDIITEQ